MTGNIIDIFKMNGYTVGEDEILGISGVKHHFTFLHSKDDDVVIEFSDESNVEVDLAKLIMMCRDSGIPHAVLILKDDADLDDRTYKMAEKNGIEIMSLSKFMQIK